MNSVPSFEWPTCSHDSDLCRVHRGCFLYRFPWSRMLFAQSLGFDVCSKDEKACEAFLTIKGVKPRIFYLNEYTHLTTRLHEFSNKLESMESNKQKKRSATTDIVELESSSSSNSNSDTTTTTTNKRVKLNENASSTTDVINTIKTERIKAVFFYNSYISDPTQGATYQIPVDVLNAKGWKNKFHLLCIYGNTSECVAQFNKYDRENRKSEKQNRKHDSEDSDSDYDSDDPDMYDTLNDILTCFRIVFKRYLLKNTQCKSDENRILCLDYEKYDFINGCSVYKQE